MSHFLYSDVEPVLMARAYLHMLFFGTLDDFIGIRNTHSHRLFNDHMNSMVDTEKSDLRMDPAFCRNTDQVRLYFLYHAPIVCIAQDRHVVL